MPCWQECTAPVENIMEVLQKIKHSMTILFSDPAFGYITPKNESRYLYTRVHSSIIHHGQKVQVTQVSPEEGVDKQMSSIHTMKCYSTLKRKEILTHMDEL